MELRLDTAADQPILTALRTGQHRRAATLLVASFAAPVHRMCGFVAAGADDLTYRCFARSFTAFAEFRASGSPKAWLLGIARECCVEHFRYLEPDELASPPESLNADLSVSPETARAHFEEMTPFRRAGLGLHLSAGLDTAEIAALLAIDESRCRGWLVAEVNQLIEKVGADGQPIQHSGDATLETVYPKFISSLDAIRWRVSEALLRRLDVLAAAL